MVSITLPEPDLHERSNTLHKLFTPLRRLMPRVAIRFARGSPGGAITLVATDERAGAIRYREESFRTSTQVLRCRYFELWRATAGSNLWLDRAYFTLLEVMRATSEYQELLCIHTDPSDKVDLKQGPHLHVSCAPDPIRHCHFPLEFGFLRAVLKDCDSLTIAMQRAINVVARDVLPRFKDR
ncbi:MAG: hypothetical protein ABIF19_01465 [Planctomycetota bacterium]